MGPSSTQGRPARTSAKRSISAASSPVAVQRVAATPTTTTSSARIRSALLGPGLGGSGPTVRRLLQLDAGCLHHPAPLLRVLGGELGEFLGRADEGIAVELEHLRLDGRLVEHRSDLPAE